MSSAMSMYTGSGTAELVKLNSAWATNINTYFPTLFPQLYLKGQVPKILWIGCCDSRVPETTLLGLLPGEVFVHRNIANVFNPQDVSLPAAVHYAVNDVKVSLIIVAGHSKCGGVTGACKSSVTDPVIKNWLAPINTIISQNPSVKNLASADEVAAVVRLNVLNTVNNLLVDSSVSTGMQAGTLTVVGAVYDLETGLLNFLPTASTPTPTQVPQSLPGSPVVAGNYYILKATTPSGPAYMDFTGLTLGYLTTASPSTAVQWKFFPWSDGTFILSNNKYDGWYTKTVVGQTTPDYVNSINPSDPDFAWMRWNVTLAVDGVSVYISNVGRGPGYRMDAAQPTIVAPTSGVQSQLWTLMKQVNGVWT